MVELFINSIIILLAFDLLLIHMDCPQFQDKNIGDHVIWIFTCYLFIYLFILTIWLSYFIGGRVILFVEC